MIADNEYTLWSVISVIGRKRNYDVDGNITACKKNGRVFAVCVLPQHQGKGIAQKSLLEIERLHPDIERWFLDTIQEEAGNFHLYEKIGYKKTGRTEVINEKITLIFYEKKQAKGLLLPTDL